MLKKLALTKWHGIVVFSVYLLVFPDSIFAGSKYPNVKLNGFVMQSYIKTDKNNFLGSSDGAGSLGYTEVGVNGFVKIAQNFQLASQLLSRRAGETDDGKPRLDFALLDYRVVDNHQYSIGFRAGRIKNPFGFYNETRDVSFTRENIILPQSIYFERTRDLSVSSDGIQVYARKQTLIGSVNGVLGVGFPREGDVNTEYVLLGGSQPGKFIAMPSMLGRIKIESDNSKIIAAYSYVNMNLEYAPSDLESGFSGNGEFQFEMHVLSLKYNLMKWSYTTEYARRHLIFSQFPSTPQLTVFIPEALSDVVGESVYFQSVYRINRRWNVMGRYDVLFANKDDRNGTSYVNTLKALGDPNAKGYSRFAKDLMFGVQFNINRYWMSRIELHNVDGSAWLPKQDNEDASLVERKWRMVNASVSYRF